MYIKMSTLKLFHAASIGLMLGVGAMDGFRSIFFFLAFLGSCLVFFLTDFEDEDEKI